MPVLAATRFTYFLSKKKEKPLQFTVVLVLAPVVQNKQDSPALLTLCISLGTIFSSFDIPLKMIDALGMIAASCRFRVTRLEFSEIPLY